MMGLNNSQLGTVVRTLLSFVGGFLVGKGVMTTDQVASLTEAIVNALPAILALVAAIWGVAKRSNNAIVASAANVLADPTRAAAIEPAKMEELVNAIPATGIVSRVDNDMVKLANATNPETTAVVTSPAVAAQAAREDIASGAVPSPT